MSKFQVDGLIPTYFVSSGCLKEAHIYTHENTQVDVLRLLVSRVTRYDNLSSSPYSHRSGMLTAAEFVEVEGSSTVYPSVVSFQTHSVKLREIWPSEFIGRMDYTLLMRNNGICGEFDRRALQIRIRR
ncbi:hypothetical protein SCHPADRAFT_900376 [Schizopora paradoxa]|uniref:Uncharacterized protein n=1 Tax=Schizopora paradoxa TaxID=27342 RepID=A0A0H2S7K1_9AGAM|nr:hypothetical protein SCHPADRAFT_900376 [Schizopora paradoxa]